MTWAPKLGSPVATATPAANNDEDNMVEMEFFFYGNGRAGENPQDFIKKFENKDLKDAMKEEKK